MNETFNAAYDREIKSRLRKIKVTDACFRATASYVSGCEMVDKNKVTLGDIEVAIQCFIDESGGAEPTTADDFIQLVRMYL